jgi:hypothetical protein
MFRKRLGDLSAEKENGVGELTIRQQAGILGVAFSAVRHGHSNRREDHEHFSPELAPQINYLNPYHRYDPSVDNW